MATQTKSLQLASKNEAKPSGTPGPNDVFYSSTHYNYPLPANLTKATLCSQSDGNGDTAVDDKVEISINGSLVFQHDYSHRNSGRILPLSPTDLLENIKQYLGQSVEIETKFIDLYKNSNGGSAFYLVMEY